MRLPARTNFSLGLMIGGCLFTGTSRACAQGEGPGPSLGGYGAMSGSMSPAGGGSLIPYAGGFAGFMPYRMEGGGSLAFRSRPAPAMSPVRPSFSLDSPSAGMAPMSGGIGLGMGSGTRYASGLGARDGTGSLVVGLGSSPGMPQRMPRSGGMGVMPPSFGYPFRQPLSFGTPSPGMSMTMP